MLDGIGRAWDRIGFASGIYRCSIKTCWSDFNFESERCRAWANHCCLALRWFGVCLDFCWRGSGWLKFHYRFFCNPWPILWKSMLDGIWRAWDRIGFASGFYLCSIKTFWSDFDFCSERCQACENHCWLDFGRFGIYLDFYWKGNGWLKFDFRFFCNPWPILWKSMLDGIWVGLGSNWIRCGNLSLQYKKILERLRFLKRAMPSCWKSLLARF